MLKPLPASDESPGEDELLEQAYLSVATYYRRIECLRVIAIVFISGISGAVVGAVPALFQLAGASVIGDLVSVLLNSILFTFIYSITASAYLQLDDGEDGLGGAETVRLLAHREYLGDVTKF